jgi:hypothetical protein
MARYGVDYYGKNYYGNVALANYDASPFFATPVDYGKIHVTWATPTGAWTGLRLLRSSFGFPETADDGQILIDQLRGSTPVEYYDPSGVGTISSPKVNANDTHLKNRVVSSFYTNSGYLYILLTDAAYIFPGSSISLYGNTGVDGTYLVNSVALTQPSVQGQAVFPQTYTITVQLNAPLSQDVFGTGAYLLINELSQEQFYYYSIFVKTLSNTVNIASVSVGTGTGAGTVTYTTSTAHTFLPGTLVGVTGMSIPAFNISGYQVVSATPYTFTVYSAATGTPSTGGAIAGINTQWVRAGNTVGLSVKNYGTQALMYDYLPDIYKVVDTQQTIENPENPTLRSFLAIFGFYYDLLKTYATLSGNRYDTTKIAGQLIPSLLQEFNFIYEPELGFKRMRSLLDNATHIYQSKGSYTGVIDYVKSFTGLGCNVYQGKNLFLDTNSSSFESGIGLWSAVNASITAGVGAPISSWTTNGSQVTINSVYPSTAPYSFASSSPFKVFGTNGIDNVYSSSVTATTNTNSLFAATSLTLNAATTAAAGSGKSGGYVYPYSILPYQENNNPYGKLNSQLGLGIVKTTVAGTVTLTCGSSTDIRTQIPVSGGTRYTFSMYIYSAAVTRSFTGAINWYDYQGNFISTSNGTGTTSTNTSWTRFSISTSAPANAYFALPVVSIAGTAINEIHYIDAGQFEASSSATWFQECRQVQVFATASRVNEIINPNFDGGTTAPWSVSNGTISIATGEVVTSNSSNVASSAYAGEVYATSTNVVTVSHCASSNTANYIPISAGQSYTWSGYYIMSADNNPTVNENIQLQISWYDSTKTLLGLVTGPREKVPLNSTNSYARLHFTTSAPETAAYAIAQWVWTPNTAGNGILFDQLLFEKTSYLQDYFDGNYGTADQNDLMWQGAPNSSRSHYYRNRNATYGRLNSTLVNYLPAGTNYAVYYASM